MTDTSTPARAEARQAEVTEAVRAHVAGSVNGCFEPDYALASRIRDALGIDYALAGSTWEQRGAESKLGRQVKIGLDKLAGDGTLRKVSAGTRGPDARMTTRNGVRYYTPAAWDEAEAETRRDTARVQAVQDAWGALYARLAALGVDARQNRYGELRLDLEAWAALLSLAEIHEPGTPT